MRGVKLAIASCILAVAGVGVASAQFVNPLRVLEESRRDRIELDKRIAREAAAHRQKEKAAQAGQATAQLKLDQERVAAARSASSLTIPPTLVEPSFSGEIVQGASSATASAANAGSGTSDSNRLGAASARHATAPPPGSATDASNGLSLTTQSDPSPNLAVDPGASLPTAPAASDAGDTAAANQPAAPVARDPVVSTPAPIPTRVLITVDKAAQRMQVTVGGRVRHTWAVSTGRAHYETPTGTFRPLHLAKVHYSKEWDGAPMPHSIFFTDRGHAIHASNATRSLGRRASHGCVRLAPGKAATLFALVRAEGVAATKVTITNGVSARKAVRSRSVEGRARNRAHVQRAFTNSWRVGFGDRWTE